MARRHRRKVKQGEMLAVVDTPELDQRVTAAEGELAKAKANQALAKVTAERWKTLSASSAVSQQAIDEKASRRDRQGRRGRRREGQPRPPARAESVRQHHGAVRRRRHRAQRRYWLVGLGDRRGEPTALHRRRHPQDAHLCARSRKLCGGAYGRHEGQAHRARISRSFVRSGDCDNLALDRPQVALSARRADGRQLRRSCCLRVHSPKCVSSCRPIRTLHGYRRAL